MNRLAAIAFCVSASLALCDFTHAAELAFKDNGSGYYEFNTGVLKGFVRAGGKTLGMNSLVDIQSGREIAHGGEHPGLYSPYRVFSKEKRYGDAVRDWPVAAALSDEGSLLLRWPSGEDRPFAIEATYRWMTPNTFNAEFRVTPEIDLDDFELFLSSYFHEKFDSWIYVRPTVHNGGEAAFIRADVNPLLEGTYFAFPRDRQAAQWIFDGRWDFPPHPVDFSIPRFYALPIGMRKDDTSGLTVIQMSTPEDCFAVETPYNKEPPDGIAAHGSIYFSFFGRSIKKGETIRVRNRMMTGYNLSREDILMEYKRFEKEQ